MTGTALFNNINNDPNLLFVIIRSLILFILSILIIRYGNPRYHLHTPLDLLLIIILGGLISRGINGSASLISTITGFISLIIFHRFLSKLTFKYPLMGKLIKGNASVLMQNGEFKKETLCKLTITHADIIEQLRVQLNTENLDEVLTVYHERNGSITFIKKNQAFEIHKEPSKII